MVPINNQTILKLLFKVNRYPTNLYYFIIFKDIQTILKLPFKVNGYSTERDRAASAAVGDKMVVLGGRDNDGQVRGHSKNHEGVSKCLVGRSY
jgi:hypothetical protein